MKTCTKCGTKNDSDASFCTKCGAEIIDDRAKATQEHATSISKNKESSIPEVTVKSSGGSPGKVLALVLMVVLLLGSAIGGGMYWHAEKARKQAESLPGYFVQSAGDWQMWLQLNKDKTFHYKSERNGGVTLQGVFTINGNQLTLTADNGKTIECQIESNGEMVSMPDLYDSSSFWALWKKKDFHPATEASSNPASSDNSVGLDEAQSSGGYYVKKGDRFYPVEKADVSVELGMDSQDSRRTLHGMFIPAEKPIQKIDISTDQLVYFSQSSSLTGYTEGFEADTILKQGYTAPYIFSGYGGQEIHAQYIEGVVESTDTQEFPSASSYDSQAIEQIAGMSATKYSNYIDVPWAGTNYNLGLIDAKRDESLSVAWYAGTAMTTKEIVADVRCFIYEPAYYSIDSPDKIVNGFFFHAEKTTQGYDQIDFPAAVKTGTYLLNINYDSEFLIEISNGKSDAKVSGVAKSLSSSGYVMFPDSSSKRLTDADLSSLTAWELQVARNEIYARHGYIFKKNANIMNYFESKSWYHENPDFKGADSELNQIELDNIKFIQSWESRAP